MIMKPRVSKKLACELARSWCAVVDSIRVQRGIPDPGQLRPGMSPQQLLKELRKYRGAGAINIGGSPVAFLEAMPAADVSKPKPASQTAKDQEPTPSDGHKESTLADQGGGDGPGSGGTD